MRMSWRTVSKALERSMYIARVGRPSDLFVLTLLRKDWSVIVVLEFGLKAYVWFDRISCLRRCAISWSFISLSKTLAMIGRREMGL